MYYYRFNPHTRQYYVTEVESPGFKHSHNDDTLTLNNVYDPLMCRFCGVIFNSRNKLFEHLGAMGVDIRKPYEMHMDNDYKKADTALGEEGFFTDIAFVKRLRKANKHLQNMEVLYELALARRKYRRKYNDYKNGVWHGVKKRTKHKKRVDIISCLDKLSI